ncbi:MAG: transcriptional repressor [Prolixibacteraceae bacterium]|jgi:Fur family peroxide stress response transcriptional regulator|nr:transcriptional repressor [Prolixibacteraceae bacterium]
MEKYSNFLLSNGVKPSVQRLRIYEFIHTNRIHPTIEMIYSNLSHEMPTLSKTTVYNTLKLFVSKGVAKAINIEDTEIRYDADLSTHGHFKCKSCGGLFDVMLKIDNLVIEGLDNFKIEEYQVNLKGYCNVCKPN